jgi:hypothetical protein
MILRTYRIICENLIETPFRVYRQLPAAAQIGILNQTHQMELSLRLSAGWPTIRSFDWRCWNRR